MFYQIFLPRKVKESMVIINKHGIYELPHELLNDLRLNNFRKSGNTKKVSNFHTIIT